MINLSANFDWKRILMITVGTIVGAALLILIVQHYRLSEQLGKAEGERDAAKLQVSVMEAVNAVNDKTISDYSKSLDALSKKKAEREVVYAEVVKSNPEWANSSIPSSVTSIVCEPESNSASDTTASEPSTGLCRVH